MSYAAPLPDEGMLSPMVLTVVPMADSSGGGGSGLAILLPLVLIVGMIWFMSRTQRRQRQRQEAVVAALNPGTRVITTSGMVGVVQVVEDDFVTLEIAPGISARFVRQAIGRVLDSPESALGSDGDIDGGVDVDSASDDPRGVDDVQDDQTPDDKPRNPPTHTEN
jgi:preprotein translocase subunit YajC